MTTSEKPLSLWTPLLIIVISAALLGAVIALALVPAEKVEVSPPLPVTVEGVETLTYAHPDCPTVVAIEGRYTWWVSVDGAPFEATPLNDKLEEVCP